MSQTLAAKTCVPCKGGIPPLSLTDAARYGEEVPAWELTHEGTKIERRFKFKDFAESLDFVAQVGALAEAEFHHPDMNFGWGYCTVMLQTKKIKGLHENDFIMAAKIDALAPS